VIRVLLQLLQVVQDARLFQHDTKSVFLILGQEVVLATLKNIVETLEGDSEHSDIVDLEHGSQRLDHSLVDKSFELHRVGGGSAVAEGPDGLILHLHVVVLQDLYELVHDADIEANLHLLNGASGDVRQHPAALLPHGLLWVRNYLVQGLNQATVHRHLSLVIITGHDVADGPQARNGDGHVLVTEQLDHLQKQVWVKEVIDPLLGSIRQVGKSPANVSDDVLLVVFDQNLDQGWDGSANQRVLWLRPSSAKVGKGPGGIPHEAGTWLRLVEDICDLVQGSTSENAVSGGRAVSSDVANAPDDLLDDLDVWRAQQLYEMT
jgi:hypothetical protein